MFKRLTETFSATHLTAIIIAGIVAPSAVYAVSYTAVAIVDPITGHLSAVDSGRRLYTYDQVAGYTNNPLYAVNIQYTGTSTGDAANIYTVPAGKALIIKGFQWDFYTNTAGHDAWMYLFFNGGTTTNYVTGLDSDNQDGSDHVTYEAGLILPAGTLSAEWGSTPPSSLTTTHNLNIEGYLVPASAVPAPGTQEAASQLVSHGAPVPRKSH